MSVIYQTIINTGKQLLHKKPFNSYLTCKCVSGRSYSNSPKRFSTFDEVVSERRAQARRSVVVQVNSESSFTELYGYCTKHTDLNSIHHYNNSLGEHYMLIELASEECLTDLLRTCCSHQKVPDVMALQSPFVWFRAAPGKKEKFALSETVSLTTQYGNTATSEDDLFNELLKCSSVSHQMQVLYDRTVLNDVGIRLRYMVARQIEVVFKSLFANIVVSPFGSSVNGFGRMGCDLDLVLTNNVTDEMSDLSKRLVFQEKKSDGGRSPWQRHMELVAELLELRVPGAARVLRILNARVPIVKYAHEFTDVECDLCYNNVSGVYMSELLWLYGSLDPRVRPLTFAVRRWAQTAGLTNAHPGRWITNFPLTLMVLFFLQQKTKEGVILPTLKDLVKRAGKEDIRVAEDNINCTFLRDMNILPSDAYGQNSSNLETLLLQFFEFYAQFDFQDKAISIIEGVPIRKPNGLPLYIVNPLEQSLNVSRNVSFEECERLKLEVRNAAWQLETVADGERADDWGLLALIEKRAARGLKQLLRVGTNHRLVSVKDLFADDLGQPPKRNNAPKTDTKSHKSNEDIDRSVKEMKDSMNLQKTNANNIQRIKFKNTSVANAVRRIRRHKII